MAYNKKTWKSDEVITKEALNNMEDGIAAAHTAIAATNTNLAGKQDALTPGSGITITDNTIAINAAHASGTETTAQQKTATVGKVQELIGEGRRVEPITSAPATLDQSVIYFVHGSSSDITFGTKTVPAGTTALVYYDGNGWVVVTDSGTPTPEAIMAALEDRLDTAGGESVENATIPTTAKVEEIIGNRINIFAIGNSYACDFMAYMPWILNDIAPNIDYTLGIAYYSGCSLSQHWSFINGSQTNYTYYHISKGDTAWTTENSKKMDYMLAAEDWDIITMQQKSTESPIWSKYQPYLDNIINYLFTKGKNYKLGWVITQASANGGDRFPSSTDDPDGEYQTAYTMFKGQVDCAKKVLKNTPISFIISTGSAIQYARENSTLNSLGTFGQLTYDGYHLQEGEPSLIAGYTAALTLLKEIGVYNMGIWGNTIRPTTEWLSNKNIPGPHGQSVGATDSNAPLGQAAAIQGVKDPYSNTSELFSSTI